MIDRNSIIETVQKEKIIAIIRGLSPEVSLSVAQALYDGGIRMVEIPLDQSNPEQFQDTANSIAEISRKFGNQMLVGAGTVLRKEQADLAAEAGALYVVSPNTNVDVIRHTRKLGMVSIPGALTPSEILAAHDAGADFIKLFPAGEVGPAYVKAIRAPISHVKLLAFSGVNEHNIGDFLNAGCAGAGISTSLVNSKWVEAGEFEKITLAAKKLVEAVRNA